MQVSAENIESLPAYIRNVESSYLLRDDRSKSCSDLHDGGDRVLASSRTRITSNI